MNEKKNENENIFEGNDQNNLKELSQMSEFDFGMNTLSLASQATIQTTQDQMLSQDTMNSINSMSQLNHPEILSQNMSQDFFNDGDDDLKSNNDFSQGIKLLDDFTIDQIGNDDELPDYACKYNYLNFYYI